MNRKIKQGVAFLLVMVTILSGMPLSNIYAAETDEVVGIETPVDTEKVLDTEKVEDTEAINTEQSSAEEIEQQNLGTQEEVMEQTELGEELTSTEELLNYIAIDSSYIEIGEEQNIIMNIGDGDTPISDARLFYHRDADGTTYEQEASQIDGGGIRFTMNYTDQSQTGIYLLDKITFVKNDKKQAIFLVDTGIDAKYGVNQKVSTAPDAEVVDENDTEENLDVVTFDESGNQISQNSISEAIEEEKLDGVGTSFYNGNIVVVLDPGHDATHGGSAGNGVTEATINLKIALYCKAELEKYSGVTVYMTRNTDACPNGGSAVSAGTCNEARVNYAKSIGANVYVSIHNNWASATSASGVEIYYPNTNYNPTVSAVGSALATDILSQLTALGLNNRGTKIRTCEDHTLEYQYEDGSQADYYAVIRNCKKAYIPAIIVEHAFMSNASDVSNFLNSDEKLQKLGIADATGIAKYYSLSKGLQYEAVFDAVYYADHNLDLKAAYGYDEAALLNHFVSYGMKEGRQASADFNVTAYRYANADLRMAYGNNLEEYYIHYVQYGKAEGRVATGVATIQNPVTICNGVNYAAVYDYDYYLSHNADLKAAFGNDDVALLNHFVNCGMQEGRQASATFDVSSYKNKYQDLRIAFGKDLSAYYTHYIKCGKTEGRIATGVKTLQNPITVYNGINYTTVYDYDYYLSHNADLKAVFGNDDVALLNHFVYCGMQEGRQASASFNVVSYRYTYQDLRIAFGSDLRAYYMHYIQNGKAEGRKATGVTSLQNPITTYNGVNYAAVFDYTYYLAHNPDVKTVLGTDETVVLAHFVNCGMPEGRQAIASFNVSTYRNNYADLNSCFGTDLKQYYIHYIRYGKAEGRNASSQKFTSIVRGTTTTVNQMVAYYNSNVTAKNAIYPSDYNATEATTIQDFCMLYYNECVAEGIDPAIAFCQSMKETNFLQYGGDVKRAQFNFAGMSATGNGATGSSFGTVTEGIRAHVQHLKAYAVKGINASSFTQTCVDPLLNSGNWFTENRSGISPYVEWLGASENPFGYGWAIDSNYGYSILNNYMAKLYTF